MKILVACEESQRVCVCFREKGNEAYSCDIQPSSGGFPQWHIMGDCIPLLNGNCNFETEDGAEHYIPGRWDMIIAHPPCTRLCNSGQRWFFFGDKNYRSKKRKEQEDAISFFLKIANADCEKIAIENPVGIMSTIYKKPTQIYNPYDFIGETEQKATCLWLKGLPTLKKTQILRKNKRTNCIYKAKFDGKQYSWNDPAVKVFRSKTPWGVARAMAKQWG